MKFINDPSLALYLPLHESDGASFASKDACAHLCTVTGAPWTSPGRSFDGVDDNIEVGSGADSALDLITAMTYEVWLKPSDGGATYARFLAKTDASNTLRKALLGKMENDETNLRWEHPDLTPGFLTSGPGLVVVNAWNHIVGTYVNTPDRRIYLNGVQVASDAPAGTIASTLGGRIWIGALFTSNQNFLGVIGEVRIYNRALSPQEVEQNYVATKWRYQ